MNKIRVVRAIVALYFVGALAGSLTHTITAVHKLGLHGWEAVAMPFMIDGLAILGLIMRSAQFASHTRRTGARVQFGAGVVQLAANVYAASNLGGVVFGAGLVATYALAEWLSGQLDTSEDELATRVATEIAVRRSEAARKAAATRKANANKKAKATRKRKVQADALEELLHAS